MKIKILKDEYLFSEQGTHICDENGFAIRATEDIEVEVLERIEFVQSLIIADRLNRGLDADGVPIPTPPIVSEAAPQPTAPVPPVSIITEEPTPQATDSQEPV